MIRFVLYENQKATPILIEKEAYSGVKKIADRVAKDLELVTDKKPQIYDVEVGQDFEAEHEIEAKNKSEVEQVVFVATLGKSEQLKRWEEEGKISFSDLEGKRETYLMQVVENPFSNSQIQRALVIAGNDKRGTIYGLFRLSELCGVSSLVYFGDAAPAKKDLLVLECEDRFVSKEPSVRYRGFFINDEWPAFGNWCKETFGGVNRKAYEEIFTFLLRMKGNYMWPAMWNSVFSEEGPGLASAELADELGVVIGLSHHEPMCRAGAEWQNIYKEYGTDNTWSFVSNKDAITEFWKDGILRNKPFENLITIGMRGENDSKLLPENAALKDNIQVVKDAILTQHRLMKECLNEDLSKIPRMIAIYKEVENYYYGDETCEGLKDWEELKDVIIMLCDDNYGNLRGLPEVGDDSHKGGYGMYYHFDYHGAPVSYEWQNSTRLVKTWEQMTTAYEHGIKDLWIVNVGDIKGVEYPLTYFMELAYDYETWREENKISSFVEQWIAAQYREQITDEEAKKIYQVLDGWTKWSAARRPEAMNETVYHPCNYREGDRVWKEVSQCMKLAEELRESLPKQCLAAYESMIYYPAMATMNLILMNIEAGMNTFYAKRGSLEANYYAESAKRRIQKDAEYIHAYHNLLNGKWNHMMDSAHTGFRDWDDKDWCYPVLQEVIPLPIGKIVVGFKGSDKYHLGKHWQDTEPVINDGFTREDVEEIFIDLASRGNQKFTYEIRCDKSWLDFSTKKGKIDPLGKGFEIIRVTCQRENLIGQEKARIDIDVFFENGEKTVGTLAVLAGDEKQTCDIPGTFFEKQGYVAMDAAHFVKSVKTKDGHFKVIKGLGRTGDAVKAYPVTECFIGKEKVPYLQYAFDLKVDGEYEVEFYLAPRNPRKLGGPIRCQISANEGEKKVVETVSRDLHTDWSCEEWNHGVMNNIRVTKEKMNMKKGFNTLEFYAGDPGIVLERIVIHLSDKPVKESYLGPIESVRLME